MENKLVSLSMTIETRDWTRNAGTITFSANLGTDHPVRQIEGGVQEYAQQGKIKIRVSGWLDEVRQIGQDFILRHAEIINNKYDYLGLLDSVLGVEQEVQEK